nr:MAG TPA: rubredoxin iron binding domains containing a [Bacteriophage sp.]
MKRNDCIEVLDHLKEKLKEKDIIAVQDIEDDYKCPVCGQMETLLLKGMVDKDIEPTASVIDVSTTIMARDYKGLNNYGTNGVIEWK